jgi:hypothetical protein
VQLYCCAAVLMCSCMHHVARERCAWREKHEHECVCETCWVSWFLPITCRYSRGTRRRIWCPCQCFSI